MNLTTYQLDLAITHLHHGIQPKDATNIIRANDPNMCTSYNHILAWIMAGLKLAIITSSLSQPYFVCPTILIVGIVIWLIHLKHLVGSIKGTNGIGKHRLE